MTATLTADPGLTASEAAKRNDLASRKPHVAAKLARVFGAYGAKEAA